MKIAILSTRFGDRGRYATELAYALSKSHEVYVVTDSIAPGVTREFPRERTFAISNHGGFTSRNLVLFAALRSKRLFQLKKEFSFEVTHSTEVAATTCSDVLTAQGLSEASFRASLQYGRPNWAIGPVEFLHLPRPLHIPLVHSYVNYFVLSRTKRIVCPSARLAEEIVSYCKVDREKIDVIPFGVDVERFHADNRARLEVRSRLRIGEEPILIFVGGDFPRKGLDVAIRSLQLLSGVHLIVVGGPRVPHVYAKLAKNLGVTSRIHPVLTSNVEQYYAASDVFILPSFYDPFAHSALEAMASGVPVVVSTNVGVSEFIQNFQEGIIVNPGNHIQLAKAVGIILDDRGKARRMGDNARKRAEKLTWDMAARMTIESYSRILEGQR